MMSFVSHPLSGEDTHTIHIQCICPIFPSFVRNPNPYSISVSHTHILSIYLFGVPIFVFIIVPSINIEFSYLFTS